MPNSFGTNNTVLIFEEDKSTGTPTAVSAKNVITIANASGTNTYSATASVNMEILWAHVTYVSSATVGARELRLGLYTPGDVKCADFHTGQDQAAGTTRHYVFSGTEGERQHSSIMKYLFVSRSDSLCQRRIN